MSVPKPHWFRPDTVMISTAPTCGISKSGGPLAKYDDHGRKIMETDPVTGEETLAVDDLLLEDMQALQEGRETDTLRFFDADDLSLRHAVPSYYDRRYHEAFSEALATPEFEGFTSATLGAMIEDGRIVLQNGHGSAPKDLRTGDVPYIKVSDLRAGLVNINPTNYVPLKFAQKTWGNETSDLQAFDIISPERASRNIGDFCVLMPGQEQIMLTKEVIVLRPGPKADFDSFYLLWAMTLKVVRDQWNRIVFMQTNREDVGERYLELEIPVAPGAARAAEVSEPFRRYFKTLAEERDRLVVYLQEKDAHHFLVTGAEAPTNHGGDDDEDDMESEV